eukprot:TRINITY_DN29524_c0_g1_i1.p1 TRINITY_DN29524_c0_g1~~TRINITY_DN29524_c0_g1_i1.p1  ORF type:complete len:409 (-),score=51.62 TRINITY_DN29524_c0_g1_i1:396-1577(-)
MARCLRLLVALFSFASGKPAWQISGRHRVNEDGSADFDMPGVTIRARITNVEHVDAVISKVGAVDVSFVVFCDAKQMGTGNASFSTSGWESGKLRTIRLCSDLDPKTEHDVVIFKSTEAMFSSIVPSPNYVTFHRFTSSMPLAFLDPPKLGPRKLEFLGDSITAGFCNLCPQMPLKKSKWSASEHLRSGVENGPLDEAFIKSWATLICQKLDAECHSAAWSGYGMAINCCGGNTLMSDVWKRTLATVTSADDSDPHGTMPDNLWNFSSWKPDGVVINLGTNDNLIHRPQIIEAYKATYLNLVLQAAKDYGTRTRFFLACGPMDNGYCPEVQWVIDEAAQRGVQASFVDFRGFDNGTFGPTCCGHPSAEIDVAMADYGADVIARTLGWTDSFMV